MKKPFFFILFLNLAFASFPYWIEYDGDNSPTGIWVKTNLTAGTNTIYVYYGGQQSLADGDKTFEFFDDFEGTELNTSKWVVKEGDVSVSGGYLKLTGGDATRGLIDSLKSFSYPVALQTKVKGNTNYLPTHHFCSFRQSNNWDNRVDVYGSSTQNYIVFENRKNGDYTRDDIQVNSLSSWHVYKIIWESSKSELYFDGVKKSESTANIPTVDMVVVFQEGTQSGRDAYVDWAFVHKYDPDLTTSIRYGPEETGSWTINGQTYTKRRQVNITANKAETDYQILLDYSQFNDQNIFITKEQPTTVKILNASPPDGYLTPNKTINITYTVKADSPTATVELYIDDVLKYNETIVNGTHTLNHVVNVSYGQHNYTVKIYDDANADELTNSFEVYFNITPITPEEGAILSGNTTVFKISTNNLYPIWCEYYFDTNLIANETYAKAGTYNTTLYGISNGTHTWQAKCFVQDNPSYSKQTPIIVFHQNFISFENKIKLSVFGNVYATHQRLFFDNNHNLWLLFFVDNNPTDAVYLARIEGNEVKETLSAGLNLAGLADYFVYLPNSDGFDLLAFNANASEYHLIRKRNGTLEVLNYSTSAITNWDSGITAVYGNTFYDPWSFINLPENYTLTEDSFVIFDVKVMTTDGEKVIYFAKKPNEDTLTLVKESGVYSTGWSVAPQETAPKTKNLSVWVVPYISKGSNNKPRIDIYEVSNGGADWAIKTSTYEFKEGSKVITTFGRSTDYLFLVINNATAYQSGQPNFYIYEALTNTMYQTNKQPPAENSFPIFTAPDTFNIFEPDKTVSVYFNGSNFDVGVITYEDYGLRVPYERGEMTTRETKDGIDRIVKGRIALEEHGIVLLYTDQLYDAKFITYDEQEEYRKPFKVLIYTNTSSYKTKDEVWGYVIPSALIGGLKNVYITGRNGTKRLYIIGLNNNYLLEAWSLNQNAGIYCTYTVYNQFQIPIPNARISALRYSDLKRSWVIVEQSVTNLQGKGYLFLEPFTLYKIRVEGGNYIALEFDYTPVGTPCQVDVKLNTNGSLIQPMPDYHTLFEDISYSIQPEKNFHKKPFNITYTISSASGKLEWARMVVVKEFNHTKTVVYNTTLTSPTGGMLQYTANETGKYYAYCSFKHEDYDEYEFYQKSYWLGLNTGLTQAMEQLNENVISGWSWFLISLLLAVLVANFAAGYTKEGAGVLGIVTLWIMSLIYPNGIVVCLFQGACLTTLSATIFLTVLVGASLIATKYL